MVWPFKFGAQHMLLKNLTCSDLQLFGLDFISHAERKMLKNGGDDDGGEMMMGASASDTSTGD